MVTWGMHATYEVADAAKLALHLHFLSDEIGIPQTTPKEILVDAGAAIGFIQNTGTIDRMKHIDLRSTWLENMRNRSLIKYHRVPGDTNAADFFTKITSGPTFEKYEQQLMGQLM